MTEWIKIPPPPPGNKLGPPPYDGKFYLVAGDSGYTTTPLRVHVARWYPESSRPWQTHSCDDYRDDGEPPIYYLPQPKEPVAIASQTAVNAKQQNTNLCEVLEQIREKLFMIISLVDKAELAERVQYNKERRT
jgi:hypothetical protein